MGVLQDRFSSKFCNIHRKTAVLESLFTKVADLKSCNFIKERLQHRCFPVNVAQFLRIFFLWNSSAGWFCKSLIIFAEVWVRALSNIYDGAFYEDSENLSAIFTKNLILCLTGSKTCLCFEKISKVNLQHIMLFDTKTEVFTQNKFFWIPGDGCPHLFVH